MDRRRPQLAAALDRGIKSSPAVAIFGPRQCGKTTLARAFLRMRSGKTSYFDLENPSDLARVSEPMTALGSLTGLIVIDEVQRQPNLFQVLRVLADRRPLRARFLLLGSASPELLQSSSETLAGRIRFIEMTGFTRDEIAGHEERRLWLRGGFPRSFLARSDSESLKWREDFIRTFLERDLGQLGSRVPAATMRRLWTMLAHYSGGIWNGSEIGAALGESHVTVRRHLDLLAGALVIRILPPWFENVGKRQIRAPKIYVRDSGLLHALLGIFDFRSLQRHPKFGLSWEGFVIEQLLNAAKTREAYYWRTQAGAELDLLLFRRGKRIGVEIKYADAPTLTKSMHIALADLQLDRLIVVYPGEQRYALAAKVEVMGLADAWSELA